MPRFLSALLLCLLPSFVACSHVAAGPVVTVEYAFDLEEAHAEGWITAEELAQPAALLEQTMQVLRQRLDPAGVLDPEISIMGNHIVVKIPETKAHKRMTAEAGKRAELLFRMALKPTDLPVGTDMTAELERARTWLQANPGADLRKYNLLPYGEGGPWRGADGSGVSVASRRAGAGLVLLKVESDLKWQFGGDHFKSVEPSTDAFGYPALSFEFSGARKADFEAWTKSHVGELLAIVLDGEVLTMPSIESALPGSGLITGGSGGFDAGEVESLVAQLRAGLLPIPLSPVVR